MIRLTRPQYNSIPADYRSVWTNEAHPELIGKRTAMENSVLDAAGLPTRPAPSGLILEGIHFEIIENYKYRLTSRGQSSDRLGLCEVCFKHVADVHYLVESREYKPGRFTRHKCIDVFGHKECLEKQRKN